MKRIAIFAATLLCVCASCTRVPEMTEKEIDSAIEAMNGEMLSHTRSKPWTGGPYVPGRAGGTWYDSVMTDPKTFNHYIAERDASSSSLIAQTTDFLFDYDPTLRKWSPRAASYAIDIDRQKGTLTLHCTLRDDMYWTYYDSPEKIPVTSDDVVFWYDEIAGDKAFQSSGYPQQFMTMDDGSVRHIDIVKIDDKRFDFLFPRIVAEPLLAVNMNICPSFIYRPAKEAGGVDAVKNLFSIASSPRSLPSAGKWYIAEYAPSQRIVLKRNPHYWNKDANGISEPYPEEKVLQIVGDENTDYLLFRQGKLETYQLRPEDVNEAVADQRDFTVYNAEGSLGSSLWSFNQNPVNEEKPFYSWFTKKEFRQAMSCLLNRERIIVQTYRGLAEPMYYFFSRANPYYNPDITLRWRYDVDEAKKILKKCGMEEKSDLLYDSKGALVEFDLAIPSTSTLANDIAQIIADECAKAGIKVNVRQVDFQKLVESLTATYDWQSVIIALGTPLFPSQGSNVWPSSGNLHLWHPLQASPATEWEARIDRLYSKGNYTIDREAAFAIWNEYQRILLDECPVIYLVRPRSFFAIRNRWDQSNVYYDNLNGAMLDYVFLKQ